MKKQKETDLPEEEVKAEDIPLNPVIVRGRRRRPKRDGCNGSGSSSGPAGEKTGKTEGGDLTLPVGVTGGAAGGLAGGTRRLAGKPMTPRRQKKGSIALGGENAKKEKNKKGSGLSKENKAVKSGKYSPTSKSGDNQSGQQGGRNEGGESDSNRNGQRSNGGKGNDQKDAGKGEGRGSDIAHEVIREVIKGVAGGAAGSLPGSTRRLPGKPTTSLHGKKKKGTTRKKGKTENSLEKKIVPKVSRR